MSRPTLGTIGKVGKVFVRAELLRSRAIPYLSPSFHLRAPALQQHDQKNSLDAGLSHSWVLT